MSVTLLFHDILTGVSFLTLIEIYTTATRVILMGGLDLKIMDATMAFQI